MKMKYIALGAFLVLAMAFVVIADASEDSDAGSYSYDLGQKNAGTSYEYSQFINTGSPSSSTFRLQDKTTTNCGASVNLATGDGGFYLSGAYSPTSAGSFSFVITVEEVTFPIVTHTVTFSGTAIQTYTCNLYYNANGGSNAPSSQSWTGTSTSHTFTIRSSEPTRVGHDFLGWATTSSATTPTYQPGDSISVSYNNPRTLYAVWQPVGGNYDLGEKVAGTSYEISQYIDTNSPTASVFRLQDITKTNCGASLEIIEVDDGFTIQGRYQPTSAGSFSFVVTVQEVYGSVFIDHVVTFSGTATGLYTCYLNYDANGGSGAPSQESYSSPSATAHDFVVSDVVPVRSGYNFLGWATSSTATASQYSAGDSISVGSSESVTLYAIWDMEIYETFALGSIAVGDGIGFQEEVTADTHSTDRLRVEINSTSRCIVSDVGVIGSNNGFTVAGGVQPSSEGPFSFILKVTQTDALLHETVYFIQFTGTGTVSPDFVYWSNGNYNGRVDILYKFDSPAQAHIMTMDLYTPTTADHRTTWTDTGKDLSVTILPSNHRITASVTGGSTATYNIGTWNTMLISIDTERSNVSVTPIKTFTDFTDFTLNDRMKHTILDFSATITDAAIETITHSDTGDQANRARFSVVDTWPFLDSYGVILQNPSLNFHDYFPQFESIRVNFYSFALFGDSITINGMTYPVTDGKVTVTYVTDDGHNYLPEVMPNRDPTTRTFELNNIYVTFSDDGHAYLTFNDKHFTLDLGLYQPDQWVVSMSGTWYFTSMAYEPYTATEKSLSGWKTLPTTSANEMILIFLGILCVAFAAVAIHVKRSGFGILDLVIIGSAALVAFLLLG